MLTKEVAQHFTQHVRRVLAGFAATTVIRYITTFNGFARTCEELEVCILSITEVQAADILVTLQLQKREGLAVGLRPSRALKRCVGCTAMPSAACFKSSMGQLYA